MTNKALKKDLNRLIRKHYPGWTDNNIHDPGVSLLDVLVYTIDEVRYRARLDLCNELIEILECKGVLTTAEIRKKAKQRRRK
jgi:hypothetical protein